MMKNQTVFVFLLLLLIAILTTFSTFSFAAEARISPNFLQPRQPPEFHFNTNMFFSTDFVLSAPADQVVRGNPSNLESGNSVVCSNARITATPRVTSRWATGSEPNIVATYPRCSGSVGFPVRRCPPSALDSDDSVRDMSVRWLASDIYDPLYDFANIYGVSTDWPGSPSAGSTTQERYNRMGIFYNQRVSYVNVSGDQPHENKLGRVNVFCKGIFQITGARTTQSIPIESDSSGRPIVRSRILILNPGRATLTSRLTGMSCYGSVVNYPSDWESRGYESGYFRMSYFTRDEENLFSSSDFASRTKRIDVVSGPAPGSSCSISSVGGEETLYRTFGTTSIVRLTIRNDGASGTGAVNLTSVRSASTDYDITPLDDFDCRTRLAGAAAAAGISLVCPGNNGFNTSINPGGQQYVYLTVERRNLRPSGTVGAEFSARGQTICGVSPTCGLTVDLTSILPRPPPPDTAIRCTIDPSSITFGSSEIARFRASCTTPDGATRVACNGNDWRINGLSGGFVGTPDNSTALVRGGAPAIGSVSYRPQEGEECSATGSVGSSPTQLRCDFDPVSVTMNASTSQYFRLQCTNLNTGGSVTPTSTPDYRPVGGLLGTVTDQSTRGANFTAASVPSVGQFNGTVLLGDSIGNIIGYETSASVRVVEGGGRVPTGDNRTRSCTVTPSADNVSPMDVVDYTVTCLDNVGQTIACNGNDWRLQGLTGEFFQRSNINTQLYISSPTGTGGFVEYLPGGDSTLACRSNITMTDRRFDCSFRPDRATLNVSQSQYFELRCLDQFRAGQSRIPDGLPDYRLTGTLTGALSQRSAAGVNFTAQAPSSGNLAGVIRFNDATRPTTAVAPITIIVGGGQTNTTRNDTNTTTTNTTSNTTRREEDRRSSGRSTDFCQINEGNPFYIYPGVAVRIPLRCGPDRVQECTDVTYSFDPSDIAVTVSPTEGNQLYIEARGRTGTVGVITVAVRGVRGDRGDCSMGFEVSDFRCVELS